MLLGIGFPVDEGEGHLVERLVQNARYAQDEEGPGVGDHPAQQAKIHVPADAEPFGEEENGDAARTHQVDEEDVVNFRLAQPQEVEAVKADVEHDEQHLEGGKLDGTLLKAEVGEGEGLDGIQEDHGGHH